MTKGILDNEVEVHKLLPPPWKCELPTQSGKYWAWAEDGDMMPVTIVVENDMTIIKNEANSTLGVIGSQRPWMTFEEFTPVFSHFKPYTSIRPKPPILINH